MTDGVLWKLEYIIIKNKISHILNYLYLLFNVHYNGSVYGKNYTKRNCFISVCVIKLLARSYKAARYVHLHNM